MKSRLWLCFVIALVFRPGILSCQTLEPHTLGHPSETPSNTAEEDWSNLSANRTQFSSPHALDGGTQTQSGFTRQLLQVQWRQGDPIDLYIIRPANSIKPPVVLFLYSWPTDTDTFRSDAWCRNVTQHGFAAIGFVSALTGQRYHDRPWRETFVSELPETLGKTVHDIQLLLDYLQTRSDLDTTRAGIFGQGSGGTIALLAATVEPRLKAIDVIDPWGDWPDWFDSSPVIPDSERAHFTSQAYLSSVAPYDPIHVLSQLSGRPVRLEETALNPSTPIAAKAQLKNALPPTASYIAYANEADYRARAMEDGKILEWMQTHLIPLQVSGKPVATAKTDLASPSTNPGDPNH